MKIILGSASAGRRKILKEMGYDFEVMVADIDEKKIRSDDPEKLTLMLARAKADALLPKIKEPALLITVDTIGVCRGRILEKPENEKEVRKFLNGYKNSPAETVTAVIITDTATGKRVEGVDAAAVIFSPIPEAAIKASIEKGDVFDQSGSFSIDDEILGKYVRRIKGEPESIIGLPKKLTRKLLNRMSKK